MIACGATLSELKAQQHRKLLITSEIYRQQQEMYDADSRRVNDRIVNLSKPHVRPIVRGKAGKKTEFGAKVSISDDNGFVDVAKRLFGGLRDIAKEAVAGRDPVFWAIREAGAAHPVGVASYLRITPEHGVIEVGHICLSPALQRSRAATEAMFLMMDWAFSHGYRRYEWKCNALNMASRGAAQRLGFSYEGIFRQATVVKGRNRDTAWFAVIDAEWPALREAYAAWLSPRNFDAAGRQKERLSDLTRLVRAADDPALR